jgi:exopolysaccharide biosynthesis protein
MQKSFKSSRARVERRCRRFALKWAAVACAVWLGTVPVFVSAEPTRAGTSVSYSNDKVADVPWSIHVVKVSRANADYEIQSVPAIGRSIGLTTLSDQVKSLPPSLGTPVAAINGDFWIEGRSNAGDPMGLQISEGELISAPSDTRPAFWIDIQGQPQMGKVQPLFKVTWPNGANTPLGLNSELTNNGAILFTPAIGANTRTKKARELILEPADDSGPLTLAPGKNYSARVREVREGGNASVAPGTLVLALSGELAGRTPAVTNGAVLQISMATSPDLAGVHTAIGGGPTLVNSGKPSNWNGHQTRHPRTAIGWNKTHLFFVQVDGRQRGLSVGMTFGELTEYMVKLGCEEAMNLDGGGSSTLWVFGRVVNSPCYGHEREMANSLVLVYRDRDAARPVDPD